MKFTQADVDKLQDNLYRGKKLLTLEAGKDVPMHPKETKNKYSNIITEVDGIKFRSKKEAKRYGELKLLEKTGDITGLSLQVKRPLIVDGIHITTYTSDFEYSKKPTSKKSIYGSVRHEDVVEDVKSNMTRKLPLYQIKKRLMKACYGIEILET